MLTIVKLVQSLVKALHSEGTPGQLAAGIALGAILTQRDLEASLRELTRIRLP